MRQCSPQLLHSSEGRIYHFFHGRKKNVEKNWVFCFFLNVLLLNFAGLDAFFMAYGVILKHLEVDKITHFLKEKKNLRGALMAFFSAGKRGGHTFFTGVENTAFYLKVAFGYRNGSFHSTPSWSPLILLGW
jgi:hypothetical protein